MRPMKSVITVAMMLAACTQAPRRAATPAASTLPAAAVATATMPDGYKLVWADEFNVDGPLNPKEWGYDRGFVRNEELQWYQQDNAICKGGYLVIEARRETKPNPNYVPGSRGWQTNRQNIEYTAASVNTRGIHSWLYVRFEIRAKIDTRPGSWPAFWTLGVAGRWPANGEIDIMEYYRNMLRANIAWAANGNGATWNSKRTPVSAFAKDWSDQFHVWRMDWDANAIKLYCDGVLLNEQEVSKTVNANGVNPFHGAAYLLLNLAIGGQNGGDPSKTTFPVKYEIDYVRVYQKP